MTFSPFRVSFDGPLARSEQWRSRLMAVVFGGAALFLGSVSLSALLNASSGMLGAWTNGQPPQEISTTGVGSPVEPSKPDIVFQPIPAQAEARLQAAKPNLSPRDPRKPQPKARAQRRAQSQQKARDEWRRARADAQIERRWNERATVIGRRSSGDDFFRPFR